MNTNVISQVIKTTCVVILGLAFMGCSSVNTSLNKPNLDVQTKTSESIFLEPVSPDKRIIFP